MQTEEHIRLHLQWAREGLARAKENNQVYTELTYQAQIDTLVWVLGDGETN